MLFSYLLVEISLPSWRVIANVAERGRPATASGN
jgi:hypothetical protein